MEAAAAAKVSGVPVPAGGSSGEFIVHTKHTCDKCFQQPIIGKRYQSGVHTNYDMCSNCFDAYTGPDIGLGEVVLSRDQKHSHGFVLKLKIDNGGDIQVRRIKVSEVWGKSTQHLSFRKMMSIASSFAYPEKEVDDSGLDAFIAKAKVTYIDEDSDEITISSNGELEDAFLQAVKHFPPVHKSFLVTITLPKGNQCAMASGKAAGMPKRIQLRKVEPSKRAFAVSKEAPPSKSKTTLRVTPQKFEHEFFIHARHTCDGCSKTPIIGTRYHATKIPDFDLCGTCFEKYEGEDLDFKAEIHDRDRRMQQRWLKKQLCDSSKVSSNIAAAWSKANGDLADFLNKVQESGATIESATVYACPSTKGGAAASEPKDPEQLHTAKEAPAEEAPAEDSTPSLKEALKEAESSAGAEAAPGKSPSLKSNSDAQTKPSGEEDPLDAQHPANMPEATIEFVPVKSVTEVQDEPSALTHDKSEAPTAEKTGSPVPSHDESFLSDADGNGSIAEAIGRTLDVCVAAIEDAMDELHDDVVKVDQPYTKAKGQKPSDFSVASSIVSGVTDIIKKMDEEKVVSQPNSVVDASAPSVVTGATILKSEDGTGTGKKTEKVVEMVQVESASFSEDEWSVVSDEKAKSQVMDKSVSSAEPISPILLAKWDTELHQLHELGFLDDRKNIDTLELLEAAHVGVDSTEKVTVNAVVEHLLG